MWRRCLNALDTLERSAELMRLLLADATYERHLAARGGRQGVVLGHADISKEGGICNARYAIYRARRRSPRRSRVSPVR